jgi:hypothetical protein
VIALKELGAHAVDDLSKRLRRRCLQGVEAGRAVAASQSGVVDADCAEILTAEDDAVNRDDGDEAAAVDVASCTSITPS